MITKPYWWQKKQFWIPILIAILLALSITIIKFQRNKQKRELQKRDNKLRHTKLELKAIYAQLNPHFIFNALTSMQGLINKKEIEKANIYLSEFSNLLRDTLKHNDSEFVPLTLELKTIDSYIKLEQLRFNFNFIVRIAETINTNVIEIPPLLLQPILENAIKHGIAGLSNTAAIQIEIGTETNDLLICISDNGSGFNTSNSHKGYGLKLTNDRINLFNSISTIRSIKMNTESSKEAGTTVHLIFKNWLDT